MIELLENTAAVLDVVQDFYERHPYPPPVENLEKSRELWRDPIRRRADHHLFWPGKPFRENHSILVAGCGTSQAAKHAIRWPHARVTGIDFSLTSVERTNQLKQKYRLDNLTVVQLPLERVAELDSTFDQVVCTGVLHHLPNPDAGLAALRQVLKPDGAMHLMVYAQYGRTGIYMLQEFCHRLGITATDDGIRDLTSALGSLPPGHPLHTLFRGASDFRGEADLIDALLHPQDRAYTVPQLFEFLENGGLKFGRWVKQAPYSVCGLMEQIPQSRQLADLRPAERYAAVELFRGTMVAHSVVAYRDDAAEDQVIDFAGDAWPRYVPIRIPDTICVTERLPKGAAGVLINRVHTFSDIYLPISAAEKGIYDAIDGTRSISELATGQPSEKELVRSFLKQLYLYDQVVFDISRRT
jgi:SAM-dependent methyltransferase